MNDRIESIRRMLAENGEDVFLHYSLGKELAAAGRHDEAGAEFDECLRLDPKYVAACAEAGKSRRAAGDLAGAREVFQRGMELARSLGERHAADFLRQQLEALGD